MPLRTFFFFFFFAARVKRLQNQEVLEETWGAAVLLTSSLRERVRLAWPFPQMPKWLGPSLRLFSAHAIRIPLVCFLKRIRLQASQGQGQTYIQVGIFSTSYGAWWASGAL